MLEGVFDERDVQQGQNFDFCGLLREVGGDGGLVIDCNGHTLNIPANVDPASEIQRINNEPPKYEAISFKETMWRPEDLWCAKGARIPCDALTMKYGDMMIHLCSRNTIRVGRRGSKNDIAINDWRDKEHFDGLPSRTVSQCHGLFSYRRDGVVYEDCSRYGSEVSVGESKMMLHRTESNFSKDKPYKVRLSRSGGRLSFGGISMDFKIHQCRWCSDGSRYFCDCPDDSPCQTCSCNRCKALSLHRTDGLPEAFLFVWQCCDLGVVQPELTGYIVYRRNGMFLLETPDHKLMYLCPDDQMSIPVGDDKRLQLGPLSQPKFK